MFRTKFIPKTVIIFFLVFLFFVLIHEKYRDKPIRKNRVFHTIGKTQFGGVIEGLIELYHSEFVFEEVNKLPIKATR